MTGKCLIQTPFDFEQNVIAAVIDQSHNSMRSCVQARGRHFEHVL